MATHSNSDKKYAICNAITWRSFRSFSNLLHPRPLNVSTSSPVQNRGTVAGGGIVFLPPSAINCAGISLCQGRFLNEVPKLGLVSLQALDLELVFGHRSQVDATTKMQVVIATYTAKKQYIKLVICLDLKIFLLLIW